LAGVRRFVAGGGPRLTVLAVRGDGIERLHDLLAEPDRLVLEAVRLVERLRVLDARDRDRAAVLGSGGTARGCGQRGARGGEDDEQKKRACVHGHSLSLGVSPVYN